MAVYSIVLATIVSYFVLTGGALAAFEVDAGSIEGLTALTIEAMVFPDGLPVGPHERQDYLVLGNGMAELFHYGTVAERKLEFAVRLDGVRHSVGITRPLQSGVWQQVAGVFDGAHLRLYVDGGEVAVLAATGRPQGSGQTRLRLGGGFPKAGIDKAALWSVARTPDEIRLSMYSMLKGDEPGLRYFSAQPGLRAAGVAAPDPAVGSRPPPPAISTWTGQVSEDWNEPGNWSGGRVPTAGDRVAIPAGSPQPLLRGEAQAGELFIAPGAEPRLAAGARLGVSGNVHALGALGGDGRLLLARGKAVHRLGGTLGHVELRDPRGAMLDTDLYVQGSLTLAQGRIDLNGHDLLLVDRAMLAETPGNTVFGDSGHLVATRFLAAGDLSEPVNLAGLGIELATEAALGRTTVIRGHDPAAFAGKSGLRRWFSIEPALNGSLDASMVFHYDGSEVDTLLQGREQGFQLFRAAPEGGPFEAAGGAVDPGTRRVSLEHIDTLSRWTVSGDSPFTQFDLGLPTLERPRAAWGDFDGDGDLDLAMAATGRGRGLQLLENRDKTFVVLPGQGFEALSGAPAWGDFDNDNDLDLLVGGRLLRNDRGRLAPLAVDAPPISGGVSAWGDYDGDGDLDFALSGQGGNGDFFGLLRNEGGGRFVEADAGFVQEAHETLIWGDYDQDGDLDLLTPGQVLRNDGKGFATAWQGKAMAGAVAAWGDFDQDGRLDFALAGGKRARAFCRVYHNDGDQGFSPVTAEFPGLASPALAWGDVDGNGYPDLALAGEGAKGFRTLIFLYHPGQGFVDMVAGLPGLAFPALAWGDADGDRDLDLLLAGRTRGGQGPEARTWLLCNNTSVPPAPPGPPRALRLTSVAPGAVSLTWEPGQNGAAPAQGLGYNLFLGREQAVNAAMSLVAPMAELDSGRRLLPVAGNGGPSRVFTLRGLDRDLRYSWAVQSIDAAFQGSAFNRGRSFRLADHPLVRTLPIRSLAVKEVRCGGVVEASGREITGRGLIWGLRPEPTLEDHAGMSENGAGAGEFEGRVIGLRPGSNLHVRAYARFADGVAYGEDRVLAAPATPPGWALDSAGGGEEGLMVVPHGELGNPRRDFTVEFWVRPGRATLTLGADLVAKQTLRDRAVLESGFSLGYVQTGKGQDQTRLVARLAHKQGWTTLTAPAPPKADVWVHHALVYHAGEGRMELFQFGQSVAEAVLPAQVRFSPADLLVGEAFGGQLDELRLWSTARSAKEIQGAMYRVLEGKVLEESSFGLMAYYRFDEGGGAVVADSGPRARHGRLRGLDGQGRILSDAPVRKGGE